VAGFERGDLPVEPTKLEFIINLKAEKQITEYIF